MVLSVTGPRDNGFQFLRRIWATCGLLYLDAMSVAAVLEMLLQVLLLLGFELHVVVEAAAIVAKGFQVETFLHLAYERTLLMGQACASHRYFHIEGASGLPP